EDRSKFDDLMGMIDATNSKMNIIIQEFIASSRGRDLRVFIIGGRAVACMERISQTGSFKANISQGSTMRQVELTPEIDWLATETAKILNLEVAGIDLLFDDDHFQI